MNENIFKDNASVSIILNLELILQQDWNCYF